MCGVLDVRAAMTPALALGYRQAVAVTDSVLARAGDVVHGHEFHRTAAVPAAGDQPAWQLGSGQLEGHVAASVIASYLHTHWAGHPAAAASTGTSTTSASPSTRTALTVTSSGSPGPTPTPIRRFTASAPWRRRR